RKRRRPDLAQKLAGRGSQRIRTADGSIRLLISLPLRLLDLSTYGQKDAGAIFRQFIETMAVDCLWLGMSSQVAALQSVLDKAANVDQSTLEETERLLRDRLPG